MRRVAALTLPLLLLIAAAPIAARSTTQTLNGQVFLDHDADGRRDRGEPGIAGVKLSNGRDLVVTDAAGRYRITLVDGDTLFLIKPPGFAVPRRSDGLPDLWRHYFPAGSPDLQFGGIAPAARVRADFALLAAAPRSDPLDVLIFGDPQPRTRIEVGYFERDIVEPLLQAPRSGLGISLGDIVSDDLALYPPLKTAMARLDTPWLHVSGNHDLDFDAAGDRDSLLSFRAAFGPDTYAWEEPQASFIVLDNVIYQPGSRPAYIGGLREDQFAFLSAYLDTLDTDRPVVLTMHIPLFDGFGEAETFRHADRKRLFAMLQRFDHVLVLSAHTHAQQHYLHGAAEDWHGDKPLHEYNVGTTCGGYWGGVLDTAGIPDSAMSDGTPNGFARLSIRADGEYALRWQVAREPADYQIALHAPQVLRQHAYPGVSVYANVFMGMRDSRVEYRIDQGEWRPMRRTERTDPRILAENLRDDASAQLRNYNRIPEATRSMHLWRASLPTDGAVGEHRIDVRAFDPWRGEMNATTHYRLQSAEQ